jgi:flagellar L-ring protein precursor FlgH
MKTGWKAVLVIMFLLSGCATNPARLETREKAAAAPPVVAHAEVPSTPGSLWTNRKGSLFRDLKASNVGDIVTVAIYEQASASKEASTTTGRDSTVAAGIPNLFGLESGLVAHNSALDPSNLINANFKNDFKGSGSTTRKEDLVATLTTQIVGVLPNGNFQIAGGKTVTVNSEKQIIRLTGIVRPTDISPSNVVDSKNVLDAKIDYSGKGVVSDNQHPGWLVRILANLWPF